MRRRQESAAASPDQVSHAERPSIYRRCHDVERPHHAIGFLMTGASRPNWGGVSPSNASKSCSIASYACTLLVHFRLAMIWPRARIHDVLFLSTDRKSRFSRILPQVGYPHAGHRTVHLSPRMHKASVTHAFRLFDLRPLTGQTIVRHRDEQSHDKQDETHRKRRYTAPEDLARYSAQGGSVSPPPNL